MHQISTQLLNALHAYLLTQPMGEVEALVNGLRQTAPVETPDQKQETASK